MRLRFQDAGTPLSRPGDTPPSMESDELIATFPAGEYRVEKGEDGLRIYKGKAGGGVTDLAALNDKNRRFYGARK